MKTAWGHNLDLLACPACRRGAIRTPEDFPDHLSCETCGHRFALRGGVACFQQEFDDYSENYDQICADDLKEPKTPGVVKEAILELVSDRARGVTCDVGCGDGYVITRIDPVVRVAVGIALEYLLRLPKLILKMWTRAERIPLRDGCVDTLICTDLLEHVLRAEDLAGELSRIVSPEGKMLLAFPYRQDLSVYQLSAYKERFGKYKYVHLRSIDDELIRNLFPRFRVHFEHLIIEGMKLMEFKPYPIKSIELAPK